MIKRKIASDAPHIMKAKKIMMNRLGQISALPEFLRPTVIETQIESIEMAINQLDPNNYDYDNITSDYYSEWSEGEIADYRVNFLIKELLPKAKSMLGSEVNMDDQIDSLFQSMLDIHPRGPATKKDIGDVFYGVANSLKEGNADMDFIASSVRTLLLGITRKSNSRLNAYFLFKELITLAGGEAASAEFEKNIMEEERLLNREGRSFFKRLSADSLNALISLANSLDNKGFAKEANELDLIVKAFVQDKGGLEKESARSDGREFAPQRADMPEELDFDVSGISSCKTCLGDGSVTVEAECPVCNGTGERGEALEFEVPTKRNQKMVPDDFFGRSVRRKPIGHRDLRGRRKARDLKGMYQE
tara:strand:- start:1585 stop:2667 length:1083 start_codon:yes stop_codon:yes gene_type:complete